MIKAESPHPTLATTHTTRTTSARDAYQSFISILGTTLRRCGHINIMCKQLGTQHNRKREKSTKSKIKINRKEKMLTIIAIITTTALAAAYLSKDKLHETITERREQDHKEMLRNGILK